MAVLFRALLIWVLVLTVPAQGAAAATMAFCGPGHHGGGTGLAPTGATVSEHAHPGEVESGEVAALDASHDVTAADDASADTEAIPRVKQKCSLCASCCSLGAILTTVPVVPATDPAPPVFTTLVPAVAAFAADGPERPPRSALG